MKKTIRPCTNCVKSDVCQYMELAMRICLEPDDVPEYIRLEALCDYHKTKPQQQAQTHNTCASAARSF